MRIGRWLMGMLLLAMYSAPATELLPQEAPGFEQALAAHVHFAEGVLPRMGRIVIDDRKNGISDATWLYVHAALDAYKDSKPGCIILELNTPGGEIFAAQRISDALKEMDTQYGIPIIAYINNWAISAGAMLAYSCRFIVIAKDASMGAAEPIYLTEGGMEAAPEKVNSALRADFANRAQFFDRNPYIAEAMVDKDITLVCRHGVIMELDTPEEIRSQGPDPDIVISRKGKLLTLSAQQMMEYGVADFMLKPIRVEPITTPSVLISIDQSPLSEIPFFSHIPNLSIDTFRPNWQTQFLGFLITPAISSLLVVIMLVSFYLEMNSPGAGLPAAVGVMSLFLVLLSSFAMEAIHWLEPLLLFFGVGLILMEVFAFPTLGLLGVVGGIAMIVGLFGMLLPGIESITIHSGGLNAAGDYVVTRLAWLSGALIVAVIVMVILSRGVTRKLPFFKRLILTDAGRASLDVPACMPELPSIGSEGRVVAALRPAGKIAISDQDYDAISRGAYIAEGKMVYVVGVEGAKVVVEERYT